MDKKIIEFLQSSKLLSFGVVEGVESSADSTNLLVYMANCYYAFDIDSLSLVIKSKPSTKHITLALLNPHIGVSIADDSTNLAKSKGIQIKAYFKLADSMQKKAYYKQFPFAMLVSGEVYALEILWAKYTNNALSSKIIFEKSK